LTLTTETALTKTLVSQLCVENNTFLPMACFPSLGTDAIATTVHFMTWLILTFYFSLSRKYATANTIFTVLLWRQHL